MGSQKATYTPDFEARPIPKKLYGQLAVCCENPDKILFLDIETTGLSHYYDEITIVGWSLNGKSHTFVKGQDPKLLLEAAKQSVAMVTYNGIRFDKRFLEQEFPEICLPDVHVDLMYLCRRVKLTGGQKAIEKELGISVRGEIEDIDGFAAVLLWHQYLRGDLNSLRQLIKYNRADIAAMGGIFDLTLDRLKFEPDLFGSWVKFEGWAAPSNMHKLPKNLTKASPELNRAPTFRELFDGLPAAHSKIVGIDLTGSEARPTGWCSLDGASVETRTISTDADIIAETLAENPDLISIDSPLCLPFGRNTVFDDDPTRDEFGIMRECERELKRRGVNVYPSLLPSMQKLTARGIMLANIFREKGVPVIESYPGAAQDIMRIPRKGAGEKWLKVGLGDFGVTGDFLSQKVTHDELDAITSALVGTFHLAALSEELGNHNEPPLIIPDLKITKRPLVIGVSGPIAAGKTTFARILEKNGYKYTRFSLVIDDILNERKMELNRANRQKVGVELNQDGRQRELAERTLARVEDGEKIVVDGLRFPEDHAFLIEKFGFSYQHIFLDAEEKNRRIRYAGRSDLSKSKSDKEFDEVTKIVVEGKVKEMKALAHTILSNDSSKPKLEKYITQNIASLEGEVQCQYQSLSAGSLVQKAKGK